MCWLPTGCALTARQRPRSAVCSARARIAEEQSGREFASTDSTTRAQDAAISNRPDQPNDSCLFTAVQNMFNVQRHLTSRGALRVFRDEASGRGEPPPRPESESGSPIFRRPNSVRVTAPTKVLSSCPMSRGDPAKGKCSAEDRLERASESPNRRCNSRSHRAAMAVGLNLPDRSRHMGFVLFRRHR
jgi:hypothetical protein